MKTLNEHTFLEQRYLNEFVAALKENYQKDQSDGGEVIIKKLNDLEQLSFAQKYVLFLVNFPNFELPYIGKNIKDFIGYNKEEILEIDAKVAFKLLSPAHLSFPIISLGWLQTFLAKERQSNNFRGYFGGFQLRHKNGNLIKALLRINILSQDEEGFPELVLGSIEDISHLVKGEVYWGLYIDLEGNNKPAFFRSDFQNNSSIPAISNRELEILELIKLGRSSKQIGEQLNISVNTVEKHRKNMIARLGAKDSTALLQLCTMCDIL